MSTGLIGDIFVFMYDEAIFTYCWYMTKYDKQRKAYVNLEAVNLWRDDILAQRCGSEFSQQKLFSLGSIWQHWAGRPTNNQLSFRQQPQFILELI